MDEIQFQCEYCREWSSDLTHLWDGFRVHRLHFACTRAFLQGRPPAGPVLEAETAVDAIEEGGG